jgi:hypothetical protein
VKNEGFDMGVGNYRLEIKGFDMSEKNYCAEKKLYELRRLITWK